MHGHGYFSGTPTPFLVHNKTFALGVPGSLCNVLKSHLKGELCQGLRPSLGVFDCSLAGSKQAFSYQHGRAWRIRRSMGQKGQMILLGLSCLLGRLAW